MVRPQFIAWKLLHLVQRRSVDFTHRFRYAAATICRRIHGPGPRRCTFRGTAVWKGRPLRPCDPHQMEIEPANRNGLFLPAPPGPVSTSGLLSWPKNNKNLRIYVFG